MDNSELIMALSLLCSAPGISGGEDAVRGAVYRLIGESAACAAGGMGNIVAGPADAAGGLVVCAQLDEPGFLAAGANESGGITLSAVSGGGGRPDARCAVGSRVIFPARGVLGVIGTRAVHRQSREERTSVPDIESLSVDIGASGANEALMAVSPGDCALYDSQPGAFGGGLFRGRSAGTRAGAAALAFAAHSLPQGCRAAFASRCVTDYSGVKTLSFSLRPDDFIFVGACDAGDTPFGGDKGGDTVLGGGPVISFTDGDALCDASLTGMIRGAAESEGIAIQQLRTASGGGAAAAQAAAGGVRAACISLPVRYRGAPCECVSLGDVLGAARLIEAVMKNYSATCGEKRC